MTDNEDPDNEDPGDEESMKNHMMFIITIQATKWKWDGTWAQNVDP